MSEVDMVSLAVEVYCSSLAFSVGLLTGDLIKKIWRAI